MSDPKIQNCIHCGCYVNPALGEFPPGSEQDHTGMSDDPRAPGDWDNVCDLCNYGNGLRGGPDANPTYAGDGSEWESA